MSEEEVPMLDVSHDSLIERRLSDITPSPQPSPFRDQHHQPSVDARLKHKWKRQIQRERSYERRKGEMAKEKSDDNSSSIIELTKDLLVPCAPDACATEKEDAPRVEVDLSSSLLEPARPAVVTPDDKAKPTHKVLAKLDSSGEKPVYSPQEQGYYTFHRQLYAPREQDYLEFLKDLEHASEVSDPKAQQEDFAKWLQDIDKDLPPIDPQDVPEPVQEKARSPKRVAFSKENTVRFFSRTREELTQLRRKYKKTISRSVVDDEDDLSDEDDWPLFKYLDGKLKEMEESRAWDDPMAAMTDMFVPKEVKEQIGPFVCGCEDQSASSDDKVAEKMATSYTDMEDEELSPAMQVAASKAAASISTEKDESNQTQDSNTSEGSGVSALWFAVPYKPFHSVPERSESFIRPMGSAHSSDTDKTPISVGKNASTESARPLLAEESKGLSGDRTTPEEGRNVNSADEDKPVTSPVVDPPQISQGVASATIETSNTNSIETEKSVDIPIAMASKGRSQIAETSEDSSNCRSVAKHMSVDSSAEETQKNWSLVSDTSSARVDPDAPKKESLSWLADDLDESEESRLPSISLLLADPAETLAAPNEENNTSAGSLGRSTNTSLLRRVSEHLNDQSEHELTSSSSTSGDDDTYKKDAAPAHATLMEKTVSPGDSHEGISPTQERKSLMTLKNLFDHPALSNIRGSPTLPDMTATVSSGASPSSAASPYDLDNLVLPIERKAVAVSASDRSALSKGLGSHPSTDSNRDDEEELSNVVKPSIPTDVEMDSMIPEASRASDFKRISKEVPFDKKKQVVSATKRWAASSGSLPSNVVMEIRSSHSHRKEGRKSNTNYWKDIPYDRKKQVVEAAKRWSDSQKGGERNKPHAVARHVTNVEKKRHYVSMAKLWAASHKANSVSRTTISRKQGTSPSPEEGPDLDESKDDGLHTTYTYTEINASRESDDVWDGVGISPRTAPRSDVLDRIQEQGPDLDESRIAFSDADWNPQQEDMVRVDSNPWLSAEDGPDLDEAKEWDEFPDPEPNITALTASVSPDTTPSQQDEGEEWVVFQPTSSMEIPSFSSDSVWNPAFPAGETSSNEPPRLNTSRSLSAAMKHASRHQSKSRTPSRRGPSSRVKELATKFERRPKSPEAEWGQLSPLTVSPSTPWADDRKARKNTAAMIPELQQPVLVECSPEPSNERSGSNQSSPISVTLL